MVRIDINTDVFDSYYKNESLLPSGVMPSIASYIDERLLREISIFFS